MSAMPMSKALFESNDVRILPTSSHRNASVQCANCSMRKVCLPQACDAAGTARLEEVVQHTKPILQRRHVLFRQGDNFEALYVIRAGAVKTYMISENGEEHVTGFYLPGDVVGTDGVSGGVYSTTAVALETTSVCTLPFSTLEKVAATIPNIQRYMFQVMAKEIQRDQNMMMLLSRKTAEQRVATLLLRFSEHLQQRKLSNVSFRLSMSRTDIGNYLGLAVETVCRVMTRFVKSNLVAVDGKSITLNDIDTLQKLASATVEMH